MGVVMQKFDGDSMKYFYKASGKTVWRHKVELESALEVVLEHYGLTRFRGAVDGSWCRWRVADFQAAWCTEKKQES